MLVVKQEAWSTVFKVFGVKHNPTGCEAYTVIAMQPLVIFGPLSNGKPLNKSSTSDYKLVKDRRVNCEMFDIVEVAIALVALFVI